MSSSQSDAGRQREVLRALEPVIGTNLSLLLPVKDAWQPTDFLPDLAAPDWREQVQGLRDQSGTLTDSLLVVLVAGMITEEALPNYAIALNILAEDHEGTSDRPWARWLRGWTAEENRHGDLLNAYLRLSGRVDMRSIELTVHHLLNNGFNARTHPDLYGGLVYTSFQERATKVAHSNVGKAAGRAGDAILTRICQKIAGDEARHEAFYTVTMNAVIDQDPEGGLVSAMQMLRRVIAMPGRLMDDGRGPDLFDRFAAVGQRIGVYTAADYADIVEHLVKTWRVADRSVSGKGSRAQDFLCGHAEKCRKVAEQVGAAAAKTEPVPFSWIYDRRG